MNTARIQSLLTDAVANPQRAAALARDALNELRPKVLPDLEISGIVDVPNLAAVTAPTSGSYTEGAPVRLEWPGGKGKVVSLFCGTLDGADATLSKMGLRISINGEHEIITNANSYAYARLRGLSPRNGEWLRLRDIEVSQAQKWTIQFANFDLNGSAYTPFLMFGYVNLGRPAAG